MDEEQRGRGPLPAAAKNGPDGPDDSADRDSDDRDSDFSEYSSVHNYFYGSVDIGRANLGHDSVGRSRRKTGRLADQEIAWALRFYERPAPFARALSTLTTHRVVVLFGPPDVGKQAGALALLDSVLPERKIGGVSPQLSLAQIGEIGLKAGWGYLVQDRLAEGGNLHVVQFEMRQLCRNLQDENCYLVVTTTRRPPASAFTDLVVEWEPPDPIRLFDRCLDSAGVDLPTEKVRLDVVSALATSTTPRDVVRLVDQLADKPDRDVAALLESLRTSQQSLVTKWFDAQPPPADILLVTTLSFLHRAPERFFERAMDLLSEQLTGPDNRPAAKPDSVDHAEFTIPQARHDRSNDLVRVEFDSMPGAAERRVVFAVDAYRGLVVQELWRRFDNRLWDPVDDWLRLLVSHHEPAVRLQIAIGLALLYMASPGEVKERYLRPWSSASPTEQLSAVYVLWCMCADDTLASHALDIALTWARSGNRRQRMTAVAAFGGELGLRYPGEALRWLWHLSNGGPGIARASVQAIALLFGATAAGPSAGAVPTFLGDKLAKFTRSDSNPATLARLLDIVLLVLNAKTPEGRAPAMAAFLREHSDQLDAVGTMWAEALISRPHRGRAIDALRETLRDLGADPGADELVRPLGDAIARALPDHEHHLLVRDLHSELSDVPGVKPVRARSLVAALVAAFMAAPGIPRRR